MRKYNFLCKIQQAYQIMNLNEEERIRSQFISSKVKRDCLLMLSSI